MITIERSRYHCTHGASAGRQTKKKNLKSLGRWISLTERSMRKILSKGDESDLKDEGEKGEKNSEPGHKWWHGKRTYQKETETLLQKKGSQAWVLRNTGQERTLCDSGLDQWYPVLREKSVLAGSKRDTRRRHKKKKKRGP